MLIKKDTGYSRGVRVAYPLIGDVSSTYVCDVCTQCGFMPLASSWRPRKGVTDILPPHKPNIDATQAANKSNKFVKSVPSSSY